MRKGLRLWTQKLECLAIGQGPGRISSQRKSVVMIGCVVLWL